MGLGSCCSFVRCFFVILLVASFPWCVFYSLWTGVGGGQREIAACRLARTADGKPGLKARRHSLERLYVGMIKQKLSFLYALVGRGGNPATASPMQRLYSPDAREKGIENTKVISAALDINSRYNSSFLQTHRRQ